jgi:hypothetical protein
MAQGENDGDDLAVNLSWPGAAAVVPERRPAGTPEPERPRPPPRDEATEPPAGQAPARQRQQRGVPGAAQPAGARQGQQREAPGAARQAQPRQAANRPAAAEAPARRPQPRQAADPPATRQEGRQVTPRQAPPDERRPRPRPEPPAPVPSPGPSAGPTNGTAPNETLINVLDHLSTLSRLVTGTSKASTAELEALGNRVEKAVADLDALQLRVLRSLAGFDALRLRVQKEMADRPPLTDEDVDRIADAVTERLLASVRVETEADEQ